MIDRKVFLDEITILCDWFNRDFEPATLNRLHQRLSQHLTTEQFQASALKVFDSSRFFPTVEDFVSAVKGSSEGIALEEWDKCVRGAARGESSDALMLTPQGKFALKAIGGIFKLGQTDENKLDWVKKQFVEAYKAFSPALNSELPSAQERSPSISTPSEFNAKMQELVRAKSIINKTGD